MGKKSSEKLPSALARASQRFANWRASRQRGTRIPASLWKLAAKVAAVHGVSRTAAVLRLDYYGLKDRAEQLAAESSSQGGNFVEVTLPPVASSSECVVIFEDGTGARLRVKVKGKNLPDVLALGRSFWNAN
jgi:hypothetical protein